MKHPIARRVLIAFVAPLLLLASPAAGAAQEDDHEPEEGYQTPAESLRYDLGKTAEAHGWTFEQAEAQYRVTEAIGDIAAAIASERPEVFVGTAVSDAPGGTPTLYIKGGADEFVQRVVRASGQDVIIADHQPFSYLELKGRNERLTRELIALGYEDLSSGFDITDGTITAHLAAQPGLSSDPGEIRERLAEEFHRDVALAVVDGLGNTTQHSYGGMAGYKDGTPWCTMGWTVESPFGATGVTTAGHCDGVDQAWAPGHGLINLNWRNQHRGAFGDVEWHATPGQAELAEFYVDPWARRDTLSVEPWYGFTVGESICVFGQFTKTRECGADVDGPSWSCTLDGILTEDLVRMDSKVTEGGDSGAGWSWINRAYGSHVGLCYGQSVFTKAGNFQNAIGVSVMRQ
ncbi:hypothetical protein [Glycomyces algeriensis]|uniref:Streptogrisin C n=1 Tax=Glycomyces algeriensis TaxID=256037 RepID=A0A9W6GCB2_9ACTN|nr:hypothetical protein [Glycomyces algeriensis]MDA1365659.1 hypothetical protein [Glycomyces algeriensis]MDR7351347.1 hypothetical protein [Glycomyces algeriensis]GLI44063.1 hypothetical protein GALLR39Z86_39130 [Glycomyces algeriensis]